ncbi:MAG: oligosaccharide flippase family protein [Ignavibacteriae bacterium]|nr:oligosaccharide flippase family protein [Ignavibacteriota bacterium]
MADLKNFMGFSSAGVLPAAINLLLIPIYATKLNLSEFGIIGLTSTIISFCSIFINLQVGAIIVRFFHEINGYQQKLFISSIIYSGLGISFISLSFILSFFVNINNPWYPVIYNPLLLFLLVGLIIFNSLTLIIERVLIAQQKGGAHFKRTLFASIINIIFVLLLFNYTSLKIEVYFIATLAGSILSVILGLVQIRHLLILRLDFKYISNAVKYGIPLIPHSLGGYLFMNSEIWIIQSYLGLEALGVYTIALRMIIPAKIIVNSYNKVFQGRYNELQIKNPDKGRHYAKSSSSLWLNGILIFIVLYGLSIDYIYTLVFPQNMQKGILISKILLFGYYFRGLYCFTSTPLFYNYRTNVIPFVTLSAGIANIILNLIFIKSFNLQGVAIISVISFALTAITADLLVHKNEKFPFSKPRLIVSIITLIIISVFLVFHQYPKSIEQWILDIFIFLCSTLIILKSTKRTV